MNVTIRPVGAADQPLLLRAYASTREAEMALVAWSQEQKQAFVRMQFTAQRAHYQSKYPAASPWIIERNGQPVGMVYVDDRPTAIHLLDFIERGREGFHALYEWIGNKAEEGVDEHGTAVHR